MMTTKTPTQRKDAGVTLYGDDVLRVLRAQSAARAEREAGMALALCDGYSRERGRYIEVQRPSLAWELFWSDR
jgi:hypothetical protein